MGNTSHHPTLSTELALLGMLHRHPMHAYDLYAAMSKDRILTGIWRLKQSNLYALLNRLEAEGLLAGEIEKWGKRPPRRILHLTEQGQARLLQWLVNPVPHGRDLRVEFMVKLYFARDFGAAQSAQLIAQQRAACEQWLVSLGNEITDNSHTDPFYEVVMRFRQGQIEAIIAWLSMCETTCVINAES